MRWLTLHYGHTSLVNLLGNKEAEQMLSNAYKVRKYIIIIIFIICLFCIICLFFIVCLLPYLFILHCLFIYLFFIVYFRNI